MDRTERFYKISELLRNHKVVSFANLLAKVEASRSTLKRDLKYLCERLHNPIVYCRDLGGYQLAAPDPADQHPHELPGLWFSPTEIHALLTMQQLLAGLDAGGVLTTHIAPLMERLNALLGPEGNAESTELRMRVRGLKPLFDSRKARSGVASPASNGGRGLKHVDGWCSPGRQDYCVPKIRSPASPRPGKM